MGRQQQVKQENDAKQKQIDENRKQAEAKQREEEQAQQPHYKDSDSLDDFIDNNLPALKKIFNEGGMEAVNQEWYKMKASQEQKNAKEMSRDEAISQIEDNIPKNVLSGWFRNADSSYKPRLVEDILSNKGTLNAGWNIGYDNYRHQFERYSDWQGKWVPLEGVDQSKKLSFNDWLYKPQTMYRGTHGQKTVDSDIFSSYSPNRKIAESFLNENAGGVLEQISIRPIDTWGSYQTTGEEEFLVPVSEIKKRGQ